MEPSLYSRLPEYVRKNNDEMREDADRLRRLATATPITSWEQGPIRVAMLGESARIHIRRLSLLEGAMRAQVEREQRTLTIIPEGTVIRCRGREWSVISCEDNLLIVVPTDDPEQEPSGIDIPLERDDIVVVVPES